MCLIVESQDESLGWAFEKSKSVEFFVNRIEEDKDVGGRERKLCKPQDGIDTVNHDF
jgi:hypothetical protein